MSIDVINIAARLFQDHDQTFHTKFTNSTDKFSQQGISFIIDIATWIILIKET